MAEIVRRVCAIVFAAFMSKSRLRLLRRNIMKHPRHGQGCARIQLQPDSRTGAESQRGVMLVACGPLAPWPASKLTFWFSCKDL